MADQYYITSDYNANTPNNSISERPQYQSQPQSMPRQQQPMPRQQQTNELINQPANQYVDSNKHNINNPQIVVKSINQTDILKRIIKYIVEGLAVAFAAYYVIGKNKLCIKDAVILGIVAALVFAILDTFSPTIIVVKS